MIMPLFSDNPVTADRAAEQLALLRIRLLYRVARAVAMCWNAKKVLTA